MAALTADSSATACERRAGWNACSTSARADGTSKAAPSACTTRKAISAPADGAIAHSSEPTVNSSRPTTNTRRRPSESAIPAPAMRNAANTTLYAFRTHDNAETDAPGNERVMSGNAMFTIVASTKAITPPSDAIASTVRGEGLRRTVISLDGSAALGRLRERRAPPGGGVPPAGPSDARMVPGGRSCTFTGVVPFPLRN